MRQRWLFMVTIGMSILCGCTSQGPGPAAETSPIPSANRPENGRPDRPATKLGTIVLEGDADPITFKLFDSAVAALPVAFTTYFPEDMIAEPAGTADSKAIRFVANFGGRREDEAYIQVSFYPIEMEEATARSLLQPSSSKPTAGRQFKWSLAEQDLVPASKAPLRIAGVAALGRHGDRLFRVTLHYPEEFADGFVPRAHRILDEWRWTDTNQGL